MQAPPASIAGAAARTAVAAAAVDAAAAADAAPAVGPRAADRTEPASRRRLVLIAHGSRRPQANDEVCSLTARLAARLGDAFGDVRCAFLELAEPDIPTALDAAASQGPGTVVVLPYFLVEGRHLVDDLGTAIAQCRQRHPQVRVVRTPYVGQADPMVALLAALADADGECAREGDARRGADGGEAPGGAGGSDGLSTALPGPAGGGDLRGGAP